MGKVNKVISLQNLPPELLELLHKKYPDGFQNHVIKVTTPKNDFFYGVTLDTPEISYLVKVPVKIDANPDEIEKEDFDEDATAAPDEDFGDDSAEEFDNAPEDDN